AAEKYEISRHLRELTKGDSTKFFSYDIEEEHGIHSSYSLADRTRTLLKVQDDCDYNCSICTIRLAHGHSRSDSIEGVAKNVKEVAASGTKKIVLTGINLGDFGKGFDGGKKREENFYELIQELDKLEGIERYRISSIEPNL